ncbi:hypothetical protein GCM10008171_24820 [Methylopila jiangsuensis]|uniref:Uncharacterized protein n=1 Tax=Methylopila jiangsuensis TaxID=586230 RepID=A0A9W6JKJ3_9HYPH|nr:hypothetical protein GCM10008171_24820 [Methylopila jiangsuensis]
MDARDKLGHDAKRDFQTGSKASIPPHTVRELVGEALQPFGGDGASRSEFEELAPDGAMRSHEWTTNSQTAPSIDA